MRFSFDKNPHNNQSDEFMDIEEFFEDEMADEIDVDFFDEEEDM